MAVTRLLFLLLISTAALTAAASYVDYDLDGVDDSIDLCPNTPFDVLVDAHGCDMEKKQTLPGKVLIQAGVSRTIDSEYKETTILNFFADYSYGNWDISLASNNYATGDLSTILDAEDDLFLTLGYTFHMEALTTKIMAGTTFAFMEECDNDRDNSWYGALDLDYQLNDTVNLFGYYSFTINSDTKYLKYKNFHTLSAGAGYMPASSWYTSFSYNYASSCYSGGENYQSLSWFNAYMLTSSLYLSVNYTYGLNDASYDHTISFAIGALFE